MNKFVYLNIFVLLNLGTCLELFNSLFWIDKIALISLSSIYFYHTLEYGIFSVIFLSIILFIFGYIEFIIFGKVFNNIKIWLWIFLILQIIHIDIIKVNSICFISLTYYLVGRIFFYFFWGILSLQLISIIIIIISNANFFGVISKFIEIIQWCFGPKVVHATELSLVPIDNIYYPEKIIKNINPQYLKGSINYHENLPKCVKIFKTQDYYPTLPRLFDKISLLDYDNLIHKDQIEMFIKQKKIDFRALQPSNIYPNYTVMDRIYYDWLKARAAFDWTRNRLYDIVLNPYFLANNNVHFQHEHIFVFADIKINNSGYHLKSSVLWFPFSYELLAPQPVQLLPPVQKPIPDYTDAEHNVRHFNIEGPGFKMKASSDIITKSPYMKRQIDLEIVSKATVFGKTFLKWENIQEFKDHSVENN